MRGVMLIWVAVACAPRIVRGDDADDADAPRAHWANGIAIHGFVSFAASANFNRPDPDGARPFLPGGQTLGELAATGSYTFGAHHDGVWANQLTVAAN